MRIILFIISLILWSSCKPKELVMKDIPLPKEDENPSLNIIVASCNKQYVKNNLWDDIILQNPEVFIFGGDMIYPRNYTYESLGKAYGILNQNSYYTFLKTKTKVYGIYDDHDYGLNDGGKENPIKKEVKDLVANFLEIPLESPVHKREGLYQVYNHLVGTKKVKVILLDTRYFRDKLTPNPNPKLRYAKDIHNKGTMLGEAQWLWLEEQFKEQADVYVLTSTIQVLSNEHAYEKWGNLPSERTRLISLIEEYKPQATMIVSGDRHLSEISAYKTKDLDYPIIDFTSSGMTHTYTGKKNEINPLRVSKVIKKKNYGRLKIQALPKNEIEVEFSIWGNNQEKLETYIYTYK